MTKGVELAMFLMQQTGQMNPEYFGDSNLMHKLYSSVERKLKTARSTQDTIDLGQKLFENGVKLASPNIRINLDEVLKNEPLRRQLEASQGFIAFYNSIFDSYVANGDKRFLKMPLAQRFYLGQL